MNKPPPVSNRPSKPIATGSDIRIAQEKTHWIDRASDRASDMLGSILIKEARQAIKARHFLYTFFLLLAAVVLWTLIGLAFNPVESSSGETGIILLTGYWVILGFPLSIVIPFGAYRSLAREFDDGTIQLIAISTMKSWHIVMGKMASTCLQMLVYVSVLSPCIVFTYLLRGISLPQILIGLLICIAGSISLSAIGLFLAGSIRSKVLSVGASLGFILGLGFSFFLWCNVAGGIAFNVGGLSFMATSQGQFVLFGIFGLAFSTTLVMLAGASSLISFAADNRSTLPRITLLIQQTFFLAFSFCVISVAPAYSLPTTFSIIYCHYWLIMGCLMAGESPNLSERVKRSLPKSIFARSLFSFFLPGPGRGLVFALSNMWICSFLLLAFAIFHENLLPTLSAEAEQFFPSIPSAFSMTGVRIDKAIWSVVVASIYASFFMCCTFLITRGFARRNPTVPTSLLGLLIGIILVTLTTIMSFVCQLNLLPRNKQVDFSVYSFGNGYWTSYEVSENLWRTVDPGMFFIVAMIMMIPIVMALHLASKEFLLAPEAIPERLKVEDEQRRLARLPNSDEETIDDIFNAPRENEPPEKEL